MKKRFAALLMSLCLMMSLAAPALAAELEAPEAPPAETPLPKAPPFEEESPDPLSEEGFTGEEIPSAAEEEAELLDTGTGSAANPPDHILPNLPGGDAYVKENITGGYITFDKNAGEIMAVTCNLPSVSIPSSIRGVTVKYIGSMAFWNSHDFLSSVTLPNTVEIIYGGAFQGCSKLTKITLPNSLKYIEDGAFEDCTGLRTVSLGSSTTYIGPSAFSGCTNLQQVNNTRSLTFIGHHAFNGCSSLTAMDLSSNWPFYGLSDSAFRNCTALQSFQFPQNLNEIESSVFNGCSSLGKDSSGNTIPLHIPESVTSIGGGAFCGCESIVSLSFGKNPYSDDSRVTSIGGSAFSGCTNWEQNSAFLSKVTTLGKYAFKNCKKLSGELALPQDNPDFKEIPESAFENCTGLIGALLIPDSVTNVGASAFAGCTGLYGLLTIPDSLEYSTEFGENALKDCSGLQMVFYGSDSTAFTRLCNGNEILSKLQSEGKVYYNNIHPPYILPRDWTSDSSITMVKLGNLRNMYDAHQEIYGYGGKLYIAAVEWLNGKGKNLMGVEMQAINIGSNSNIIAKFNTRCNMLYFISYYGYKPLETPVPIFNAFFES